MEEGEAIIPTAQEESPPTNTTTESEPNASDILQNISQEDAKRSPHPIIQQPRPALPLAIGQKRQ